MDVSNDHRQETSMVTRGTAIFYIIIMDLDPAENYSFPFDYKELRELLTHFAIIDKHEVSFTG